MKETNPSRRSGDVVPFARSTDYWHRRAMDNRRSRRFPEAVELLRRAAQQAPDNVDIQMDLAETLSEMECFEQSSRLLYQLLSRDPGLAECYYGLACNHYGLQKNDEALDALSHYLYLDPEGPYALDAQDMIDMLAEEDRPATSRRGELLVRRGLKAFQDEKPRQATQLLEKALRLSRYDARVRTMLSLSLLSEGRAKEALRHAAIACAGDRESVQARSALCCALWMTGKPRVAVALLQEAAKWCDTPQEEQLFCHTASQLDQHELLYRFLQMRANWTPFRTQTLHNLAIATYNVGQREKAQALWTRILRIDPDNLLAEYYHQLAQKTLEEGSTAVLPYHPILPLEENQRRLQVIADALTGGEAHLKEVWRTDGKLRNVLRWAFTLPGSALHGALLGVLAAVGSDGVDILRELLTDDQVEEDVKRKAVLLLCRLGEPTPYMLLLRHKLTRVLCAPKKEKSATGWHIFLQALLQDTAGRDDSRELAFFAADLWKKLPRDMRAEAASENMLPWVKAFELTYLRMKNDREGADRVLLGCTVSIRRVMRVLRRIEAFLPFGQNAGKGGNPDGVH